MRKKILVTGFKPFSTHTENPSEKVATLLDKQMLNEFELHSLILPVSFEKSAHILIDQYQKLRPSVVLSLGLASERQKISIERIFINCNHGGPELEAKKFHEKISKDGPDAYFTTLDLAKMDEVVMKKSSIPIEISNSAGTYVCNNISYQLSHFCRDELIPKIGFIHLPFLETSKFPYSASQISELIKLLLQNGI